jgi:hypothetical protein
MLARAVVIHAVDLRAAASGLPETGKLQRAVEQRATAVTEKLLEEAFERAGPGADVRAEMRELMLGVARWTIDTLEAAKFPGRG